MTKSTKITIIAIVLIFILAIGFVIPTAYITTTEKRDGRTKQKIFWTTRTILPKNLLN